MADRAVLRSLRDRVLAGQGADIRLDAKICETIIPSAFESHYLYLALTSSLDALAELQRRVLPEWTKYAVPGNEKGIIIVLWNSTLTDVGIATHLSECRAWLGAILSALLVEAEARKDGA